MRILRNPWFWAFSILGVLLVTAFVLQLTSQDENQEDTAETGSVPEVTYEPTPGADASPIPTPTFPLENDEPETPEIPENDCRQTMSEVKYASFIRRLLEFETVSQQPDSSGKLELMAPYATEGFLQLHQNTGVVEGNHQDIVVTIDPTSAVGCLVEPDGLITARVVPVVTVSRVDSGGITTIVNGPFTLPTHYTSWVQLDGVWYVNQEE